MTNRRQFERTQIEPIEMVIEEIEVLHSQIKYFDIPLFINEVSTEGIRFTTRIELPIQAEIRFNLPSLEVTALLAGTIAWKRRDAGEGYQYGLHVENK